MPRLKRKRSKAAQTSLDTNTTEDTSTKNRAAKKSRGDDAPAEVPAAEAEVVEMESITVAGHQIRKPAHGEIDSALHEAHLDHSDLAPLNEHGWDVRFGQDEYIAVYADEDESKFWLARLTEDVLRGYGEVSITTPGHHSWGSWSRVLCQLCCFGFLSTLLFFLLTDFAPGCDGECGVV